MKHNRYKIYSKIIVIYIYDGGYALLQFPISLLGLFGERMVGSVVADVPRYRNFRIGGTLVPFYTASFWH